MTKNGIVDALCEKGYYKGQCDMVINDVLEIITEALARGEEVQIRGFGTFCVRNRKGRKCRDIATGEMRVTADSKTPTFHPSQTLKDIVRNNDQTAKG